MLWRLQEVYKLSTDLKWVMEKIWDSLHDLVLFVKFEKREKYSWKSVTFSKIVGWGLKLYYTYSNTPPWKFFSFFELYKWWHITKASLLQSSRTWPIFNEKKRMIQQGQNEKKKELHRRSYVKLEKVKVSHCEKSTYGWDLNPLNMFYKESLKCLHHRQLEYLWFFLY